MIKFIQTVYKQEDFSFVDLFISCQQSKDLIIPYVVVDNSYVAQKLENQIANIAGISSYQFFTSINSILNQVYSNHYPEKQLFNLGDLKYLIYNYLLSESLKFQDKEISSYLYNTSNNSSNKEASIDIVNAFNFAEQLQGIFIDYLYYRTEELIAVEDNKADHSLPGWQSQLWLYIKDNMHGQIIFTDIYRYFTAYHLMESQKVIPQAIYICNITKIYRSHLKILKTLSEFCDVYWLYQNISDLYYGDILPFALQQYLVSKERNLSQIEDLYLDDINPLVANLGLQSREFIELLLEENIEINLLDPVIIPNHQYQPDLMAEPEKNSKILKILQDDIAKLVYRAPEHRRLSKNLGLYDHNPINAIQIDSRGKYYDHIDANGIYTLSLELHQSISRLQEVEFVADKILCMINANTSLKLEDFIIVAPNINDYSSYIETVFNARCNGTKIPYDIELVAKLFVDYGKTLELLDLILSLPHQLSTSVITNIIYNDLIMEKFGLSYDQLQVIEKWMQDTQVLFGNDANSYRVYGYNDYDVNSFTNFKKRVTLGACIASKNLDYILNYVSYDIETGTELLEKLIGIIDGLQLVITYLYDKENRLRIFDHYFEAIELLSYIESIFLQPNPILSRIKEVLSSTYIATINVTILRNIITDQKQTSDFVLKGGVSCISLSNLSTVKSKVIFLLGMNDGECPRAKQEDQLSILSTLWRVSDRNNNFDDKQHFLHAILLATDYLFISYIVSSDHNHESPLVKILQNVIADSFNLFDSNNKVDLKNIIKTHGHFLDNSDGAYIENYQSLTYDQVSNSQLNQLPLLENSQIDPCIEIDLTIKKLSSIFLYTNSSFYKNFSLNSYQNQDIELADLEVLDIGNKKIKKMINHILQKYYLEYDCPEIYNHCYNLGLLNPNREMSKLQFRKIYEQYINNPQKNYNIALSIDIDQINYKINGDICVASNEILVMVDSYANSKGGNTHYTYKALVEGVIIASMVANGADIVHKNDINALDLTVEIEYIKFVLVDRIFRLEISSCQNLIYEIIRYYSYSQSHPVLVHQNTIELVIANIYMNYCEDRGLKLDEKPKKKTIAEIVVDQTIIKSIGYSQKLSDEEMLYYLKGVYDPYNIEHDRTNVDNSVDPVFSTMYGEYYDSLLNIAKIFAICGNY